MLIFVARLGHTHTHCILNNYFARASLNVLKVDPFSPLLCNFDSGLHFVYLMASDGVFKVYKAIDVRVLNFTFCKGNFKYYVRC